MGSSWSALGSGTNGPVSAIAVNGTDVIAGGSFATAGGVSANNIAKWDGVSWSALGTGMDGSVLTVAFVSGNLYAGGTFTNAGTVTANHIAMWNGAWSSMSTGLGGTVFAIGPYADTVAVGGYFFVHFVGDNFALWSVGHWSGPRGLITMWTLSQCIKACA